MKDEGGEGEGEETDNTETIKTQNHSSLKKER